MSDIVQCDNTNVQHNENKINGINNIARRPPVNIEFQDLTYSIRDGHVRGGWRQLLKSVNGTFRSGELTAILGPSGAGKTTLLNILAGYVSAGVKGSIKTNGQPREMKLFKKLSTYIMQEDIIQPHLTVKEAMLIAANLKLSAQIDQKHKIFIVEEVLQLLGLENCSDTMSQHLSGGQRKRVTVGLELVNNPPVIFLDEPTSGLDNYAIKQCMDLLNSISKQGRTVICTIHQPPSSLFQTFDQVYVLANGYCVYNGSPSQLVPFLSMSQITCPPSYSPADYIIEVVQSFPESINILTSNIENGRSNARDRNESTVAIPRGFTDDLYENNVLPDNDIMFPISTWAQFVILLKRMFLQMSRNQLMLYIQFFHHLLSGLLIGLIFYGIGNNASQTISIFKYVIGVNVFFMYTYVMSPVLLFPLEVKLMAREYFNRWYSLKSYYMAVTVSSLPLLIILGIMFLTIVYFITNQPIEADRFMMFSFMGIAIGLCSQGLGYTIGASFSILNGSIAGPSILAPLLAIAVYGMGYQDSIEPFMKFVMGLSYMRYGITGFCNSLFTNRLPLECIDEIYCHYTHPDKMMVDMGMGDTSYSIQISAVIAFLILFRISAYLALKYKLNSELSTKIAFYTTKIIRMKK